MTSITLENASLSDMIRRAVAVAPTRGAGFERLAGVVLTIDADAKTVTAQATDAQVFYTEVMPILEVTGPSVSWRIPSTTFGSTIAKLPTGSGRTCTMDDAEVSRINLRFGRTRAVFNTLDVTDYPFWDYIEPQNMIWISDLGQKIKQVSWAQGDGKSPDLFGIAFGKDWMGATNRFRIAQIELSQGFEERFLVPGKLLNGLIPERGDVGVARHQGVFICMPNDQTQIRTVISEPFPDLKPFTTKVFQQTARFSKSDFQPMISRLMDFIGGDRLARMGLYLGNGEIAIHTKNDEIGMIGDIIDASGDIENHPVHEIFFNPINLRDAIASFPGEVITMQYNLDGSNKTVCFRNDNGYHSIVAPLQAPPAQEEK